MALALLAAACGGAIDDEQTVTLGVLLPFTGRTGGPAHGFERAVLSARAELGDAALGGRRLEVVFADTHSSVARGREAAETLLDLGVAAIIGVENDELAMALRPVLAARDVLLISPNVSSEDPAGDAAARDGAAAPWFRIAPATGVMADNLAKTAIERGAREVALLHTSDHYHTTFAHAFQTRFVRAGGAISLDIRLPDDRQSYADLLVGLGGARHVLLAAPAEIAARVVNDVSALRAAPIWYLTPALRTEVFTQNTVPGALVGSLGVTPAVDMDGGYAARHAERWDGDPPLDSSLFYYDAAALFALGYARAVRDGASTSPTGSELASALFAVARSNGVQTRWHELAAGSEAIAAGATRYYRGLTGPLVFEPTGQRSFGQPKLWTVARGGELLDVE